MDAAARADQLRAELLRFGAVEGVVSCQVVGAAAVVRAWGAVSDASVFEAGSVSKIVTGLLFALAIQAAEVSAGDRLDRYLPRTGRAGQATLAELATHTSGLPRLPAPVLVRALVHAGNPYRGVSLPRLVRYTRMARPSQAGRGAVYSNLGVALLGHALATAAGMSYWDLARERVLHPLGMSRSGDLPTSALAAPNRAWDLAAFAPAGGLRASVPDMLRLAGVAAGSAHSPFPAAAALALSAQAAMGAGRVGWCWMLSQREHGPVYWHNGATGASWAFIGASGSSAIAAAVPARRQRAWDTVAMQVLSLHGNLAGSPSRQPPQQPNARGPKAASAD
jgi:serine-type D-Ala-D-Ala carboxypeptidase/endopeptidase